MLSAYRIALVKMADGERFPMLLRRESGIPVFDVTVYCVSALRNRHRATATMMHALRGIAMLLDWAERTGVDLDERIRSGSFLTLGELDGLVQEMRLTAGTRDKSYDRTHPPGTGPGTIGRDERRERFRKPAGRAKTREIDRRFADSLVRHVRRYIEWVAGRRLAVIPLSSPLHAAYEQRLTALIAALNERSAGTPSDSDEEREGLAPEETVALEEAIDPASPTNPWKGSFARVRNRLLILLALKLGLRRGELLGIQIEDFDFREQTLLVRRRADDPNDPRKLQPNAKTLGRKLPITSELATTIMHYIANARRTLNGARKHGFLFVADRTGAPLALSSLPKIYRALREKVPSLPKSFSLHTLRHSWNDCFSKKMDTEKVPPAKEEKMRSYLMGWKPGSKTAAKYTRRHTRETAMKASRELQRQTMECVTNAKKR